MSTDSLRDREGPWTDKAVAAAQKIRFQWPRRPVLGVVLGSGLGDLVASLEIEEVISYTDIPGFPASTAIGHAGELVCGMLGDLPCLMLRGRCHLYEGYSREQATFPIRVLQQLGVQDLLLTCAAGGLNSHFGPGVLMLINDTIDLLKTDISYGLTSGPGNWNRGAECDRGAQLNNLIRQVAENAGIALASGTYVAVTGPNYETRAEVRFLRTIADAVGMSTVPELQLARQLNVSVAAIAVITNPCRSEISCAEEVTSAEEVLCVAHSAEPRLKRLLAQLSIALTPQDDSDVRECTTVTPCEWVH